MIKINEPVIFQEPVIFKAGFGLEGSGGVSLLVSDDAENDPLIAGVNVIPPTATLCKITGNTTGVNDFVVLPRLNSVPDGHTLKIVQEAGANCELRTPALSGELINGVDSDGTAEALLTLHNIYEVTKINDTLGWSLRSFTAVGTVVASIVPDA